MKLVLTLYKNLGSFLTTQNSTLRLSLGLGQGSDTRRRSLVVNSHVISASVHRGSSRVYLSEPVIFTLRHLQVQFGKSVDFQMKLYNEQIVSTVQGLDPECTHSLYVFFWRVLVPTAGKPLWTQLLFLECVRCFWEWQVVDSRLPPVTHQQHAHNLRLQPPVQLCRPHDVSAACCE